MDTLEIKDNIAKLVDECERMVCGCKEEEREMTDDEKAKYEENKCKLENLRQELDNKQKELEKPAVEQPAEQENKNIRKIMENKNFSLLKAIRSVVANEQMDDVTKAVVEAGQAELRAAGISTVGQLCLPLEKRATVTVAAEGADIVETQIENVLAPLREKNVLVQAGAKYITGLQGDVQIPLMTKSQVAWANETGAASDGAGTFSHVKLQPHRLTAYVDVSKQFILQDGAGAESLIRTDLVKAINTKLENTILGTSYGADQPNGLAYGVAATDVSNFAYITSMEADVESYNFNMDACKYVLSPKLKATLRNMAKSAKSTQLVFENGEVDGTPAEVTANVATSYGFYGAWDNLVIGQWGGVDLTIDPYTKAADGQVRLVINAFFDAKPVRTNAFKYINA